MSRRFIIIKIKVLADSRGRGLSELLNRGDDGQGFTVECFPGASIMSLKDKLSKINKNKFDLIVIFGGIFSVMKITYMPYRAAIMRDATVEGALQRFRDECSLLLMEAIAQLPTPVLLSPLCTFLSARAQYVPDLPATGLSMLTRQSSQQTGGNDCGVLC